ncbi:MAG: alpha/beta hydrolase fold domain-containing protein [Bifidobacteriaceae bacterium]|jgi:acetyl esterase/lipase|nr:alpha/beta hydrolase fold domain-containing protein [Bifidobacteriaceae bacterium]
MTRSAATRITTDIAYGAGPHRRLDVYEPAAANGAALVAVHGGGWWQGDKAKEAPLAQRLAGAGYLVAAPGYRFADGARGRNLYPAQAEDVVAAIGWLRDSGFGFDRTRLGVIGASSGGNLAVEAAVRLGVPAASWSGLIDLEGFMAAHPDTEPRRALIDPGRPGAGIDQGGPDNRYYAWLVVNLLGGDMARAREATPIHRVGRATGPMFLANSLDELVPPTEATALQAALTAAGVPSRTALLAGSRHAEAYLDDVLAPTLDFFGAYLARR